MTSALRGEGVLAQKQTMVMIGCMSVIETGGPNPENFTDVINGSPLTEISNPIKVQSVPK